MIVIAKGHGFWDSEYASRKVKKRFGRVFPSEEEGVGGMLKVHREQICERIRLGVGDWEFADGDGSDDELMAEAGGANAGRKPAVGNFALGAVAAASPARGSGSVTPRPAVGAASGLPPVGNFASPKAGSSRSPRVGTPGK